MPDYEVRTLVYEVEPQFQNAKVKDVLSKRLSVSDALCSRLKRVQHGILLNGEPVYVTHPVKAGDILTVRVGDSGKDPRITPVSLNLPIPYEDTDLLAIDKPAHLAVHPSRDPKEVTVENALASYLGPYENPHPVSRLDKGTTGLMLVAKSGWAHSLLKQVQHTGGMQKTYYAILSAPPPEEKGVIDAPIAPLEGSTYQRTVRPDGAPSVSEYAVVCQAGDLTLVRLIPHTGRTHQLRVHMAYLGCPLLGDWLYGKRDKRIGRPALHAAGLRFIHPLKRTEMILSAPLPKDMASLFSENPETAVSVMVY